MPGKPPALPPAPNAPVSANAGVMLAGYRQRGIASPTLITRGDLTTDINPQSAAKAKKTLIGE